MGQHAVTNQLLPPPSQGNCNRARQNDVQINQNNLVLNLLQRLLPFGMGSETQGLFKVHLEGTNYFRCSTLTEWVQSPGVLQLVSGAIVWMNQ